jgi:hypothetical protein
LLEVLLPLILRFNFHVALMNSLLSRIFFILVCEAIGTAATPGLLWCQPRVIVKMIVEKQMECRLAGETEVLGENQPQRHFCPAQNPTYRWTCEETDTHEKSVYKR